MAIRELSAKEIDNVSGGTFCLFGGLLSWTTSWFSSLCQPKTPTCYTPPSSGCYTPPSSGCNTKPTYGCK